MSNSTPTIQPLIFIGAPRSGVALISDIVFHHQSICWLDSNFEKHPHSDIQHRLFGKTSSWRSKAYQGSGLKRLLAHEFSPTPSEAIQYWDDVTREEIDFYRGFMRGKHATPNEISEIKNTLTRRLALSHKTHLGLKFTGPGRLCFLHSIFPEARFVHVLRDPASTVHSILSTEEWEYQGKHLLWWRGAYSLQELAMYDQLRSHTVAGTAFQLNKLIQTTKLEAEEIGANVLTVNYEDFVSSPERIVDQITDHANLPACSSIRSVLEEREIRCSNKVLKMPATDINTVYTWCPSN